MNTETITEEAQQSQSQQAESQHYVEFDPADYDRLMKEAYETGMQKLQKLKTNTIKNFTSFEVLACIHEEPGYNLRENLTQNSDHVILYTNSMRENGYAQSGNLMTIILKDGTYYHQSGHSRRLAMQNLAEEGKMLLKVPLLRITQTNEQRELDLFLSNMGKELSMRERGLRFKTWLDKEQTPFENGIDRKTIAKKLGVTEANISDCLKMAELPEEVYQEVDRGYIAESEVLKMARNKATAADLKQIIQEAKQEAISQGKIKITGSVLKQVKQRRVNLQPSQRASGGISTHKASPAKTKPTITAEQYHDILDIIEQVDGISTESINLIRVGLERHLNSTFDVTFQDSDVPEPAEPAEPVEA